MNRRRGDVEYSHLCVATPERKYRTLIANIAWLPLASTVHGGSVCCLLSTVPDLSKTFVWRDIQVATVTDFVERSSVTDFVERSSVTVFPADTSEHALW